MDEKPERGRHDTWYSIMTATAPASLHLPPTANNTNFHSTPAAADVEHTSMLLLAMVQSPHLLTGRRSTNADVTVYSYGPACRPICCVLGSFSATPQTRIFHGTRFTPDLARWSGSVSLHGGMLGP